MTNKVQGTGLGMAIAKSIVELMGGTIKVDSILNQGTRFEVKLTLKIDENVDRMTDIGSVLLISDDKALRHNMEASMREINAEFYRVSNMGEAAEVMQTQKMDIILVSGHLGDDNLHEKMAYIRQRAQETALIFFVDYVQSEKVESLIADSGVDGLEASRAIRSSENPLGRNIPIIAMTANAFSSDVQNCLDAGMDAHIAKPLDLAVLERTLQNILAGGANAPQEKA